jgi:hypothetical protein
MAAAAATIVPYLLIGDDTRFYFPAAFGYIILLAMAAEVLFSFARSRVLSTGAKPTARALPSRAERRRG